tara:strand:+ start:5800 stop:7218 length:1419 start_codon:yes stop_codon:yes gene_type:complete
MYSFPISKLGAWTALPVLAAAGLIGSAQGQAHFAPAPIQGTTWRFPQPVNLAPPLIIEHPCPSDKAFFGESLVFFDYTGDGLDDLAVGAFGEGRVYCFPNGDPGGSTAFFHSFSVVDREGPTTCQGPLRDDKFGYDVTAANLDDDPAEELIVGAFEATVNGIAGAGRVYIYPDVDSAPVVLEAPILEAGWFGRSVEAGDFDGDGFMDVAVAATHGKVNGVQGGRVYVFFKPLYPDRSVLILDNPNPSPFGTFGHHLAVGNVDGVGADDLYVSGIGNTANNIPFAGEVYHYPPPISAGTYNVFRDPIPNSQDLPAIRYSMHLHAGGNILALGANRKDWNGVKDTGVAYVHRTPSLNPVLLSHPTPQVNDLFGYRVAVGHFLGTRNLDVAILTLPVNSNPNPREVMIWEGGMIHGEPMLRFTVEPDSQDHFPNGLDVGQIRPGGKQELGLGDRSWDHPSLPGNNDAGRAVIYFF